MANRETRRKQKVKSNQKVEEVASEEHTASILKTGLIVIGIFIVFYVLTLAITGDLGTKKNDNDNLDDTPRVSIQYDEILAGETFNMKYDEYYVLYYDFDDSSAAIYDTIMSKHLEENSDAKIFKVDLSKGFNSIYISEKSNTKVDKIENLKLNGPTLIKIKNKKNVEYSEGIDAIKKSLQ